MKPLYVPLGIQRNILACLSQVGLHHLSRDKGFLQPQLDSGLRLWDLRWPKGARFWQNPREGTNEGLCLGIIACAVMYARILRYIM